MKKEKTMKRKKKETKNDSTVERILKASGKTVAVISMALFLNGITPSYAPAYDYPEHLKDYTLADLIHYMEEVEQQYKDGLIPQERADQLRDSIQDFLLRHS